MQNTPPGVEDPIETLERIAQEAEAVKGQIIATLGSIAEDGAREEDLVWMGRVSDSVEAINSAADEIFEAMNEAPTKVTRQAIEESPQVQESEVGEEEAVRIILAFFLGNSEARLGDIKNAHPELSHIKADDFRRIRKSLDETLREQGVTTEWEVSGKTRGTRYSLQIIAGRSVLESILLEDLIADTPDQDPDGQKTDTEYTAPQQEEPGIADGGPEKIEPRKKEVTIRGQSYYFTELEHEILTSLLEGPLGIQGITKLLRCSEENGRLDPAMYHGEFMPAMKHLQSLSIDGVNLVHGFFIDDAGNKYMRFKLPDGARIERNRKTQLETLRFTDESTYRGEPSSRERKRPEAAEVEQHQDPEPSAELSKPKVEPEEVKAKKKLTSGSTKLVNGELLDEAGAVVILEPHTKAILKSLLSGERLTVDNIAKIINPDGPSDATFNQVVAIELQRLQSHLGSDTLKRKQKKGQPARWWIVT
jgi:hypothetical protein